MVLFSRKEAAEVLGVSSSTVYQWEKKEIIKPSGYIANHPRYSAEEIERVINKKSKQQ